MPLTPNYNLYLYLHLKPSPFVLLSVSSIPLPALKSLGHPYTPAQTPSFIPLLVELAQAWPHFQPLVLVPKYWLKTSTPPVSILLCSYPWTRFFLSGCHSQLSHDSVSCPKSSILSVHINFFPSIVLIPLGPWSTDWTLYPALAFQVSVL